MDFSAFWEGLKPQRCTKSARKMGEDFPHPNLLAVTGRDLPGLSWAGLKVHKSLTQKQMWASLRHFELLLQTFVLQLSHTYVPRKQKRAGIRAEPKGMCSKISANINRMYLFICSSCLSRELAAVIKRNFKHSQLLISYLLILMFIFSHPFQLRLITLVQKCKMDLKWCSASKATI